VEWQQLEYFQALCRVKNFTKAAEELALTQSALSRSIAKLEYELGVPLFDRQIRGVTLNRYGEFFLDYVNVALKEMNFATQKLKEMIDPHGGHVSLAFIHSLGARYVPELIGKFRAQYPGIQLQFMQDTTRKILLGLAAGEIDLGLCSPHEQVDRVSSFLLREEELFLIVSSAHRLAGREEADLNEVAEDPFVIYKKESGLREIIEKLCLEAGFEPVVSFEGIGDDTIAGFVAANLGVALVPFVPGLDKRRVSVLRVSRPVCKRAIRLIWQTDRYLTPAVLNVKRFIESFPLIITKAHDGYEMNSFY